ncbi:hypothetical protein BB497_09645 [Halomonas sp. GFAJ-1]|nr:hypothetical protein BB497_09645 [Halomonas sp. GFAJ-1]
MQRFIFFSIAAAASFGESEYVPFDEAHPQLPINPSGASKLMVVWVLMDYSAAYGLRFIAWRYFNASGADPEGVLVGSFCSKCILINTFFITIIVMAILRTVNIFGANGKPSKGDANGRHHSRFF